MIHCSQTLSSTNSSLLSACFDLSIVCAIISPMYMRKPDETVLVSSRYLPKSFSSVDRMMSKTNFLIFVRVAIDWMRSLRDTHWTEKSKQNIFWTSALRCKQSKVVVDWNLIKMFCQQYWLFKMIFDKSIQVVLRWNYNGFSCRRIHTDLRILYFGNDSFSLSSLKRLWVYPAQLQ